MGGDCGGLPTWAILLPPSPRDGAERLSHRAYKSHKPHKYNNCSRGNKVRDWTHQKQKRDPKVSFCGAYGTRNREALSEQSGERTLTSRGNKVRDWTHQKQKETRRSLSAVRTGLEPVTSCVTGRHSNQAELTHLGSFAVAKV